MVQEAFVKAYSNLAGCRERDRFGGWVRRIAVNICLKRIPREVPCSTVDEMVEAASERGNPVEAEVLRQVDIDIEEVREAVLSMPIVYRTVLVLRYEEDLPYNEIAGLIDESADVVRVRLLDVR